MRDSRLDLLDTKIQTMAGSFVSTVMDFEVPSNSGNLCICLLIVRESLLCGVSYLISNYIYNTYKFVGCGKALFFVFREKKQTRNTWQMVFNQLRVAYLGQ